MITLTTLNISIPIILILKQKYVNSFRFCVITGFWRLKGEVFTEIFGKNKSIRTKISQIYSFF